MMSSKEAVDLIDAYLDGEVEAEDLARLKSWLESDESHVDVFTHQVFLHHELRTTALADRAAASIRTEDESTDDPPAAADAEATWKSRPLSLLYGDKSDPGGLSSDPLSPSLFHSSVIGWTLFGVMTVAFAVLWWTNRGHDQRQVIMAPQAVGGVSIPSMNLLSGTAELVLPDIGRVFVDGPAEFEMLSPMRARLTKGRVRVHVTEESGVGFVVETPYGEVTDLGTEFGLDIPENGEAGLVVFDGAVDLRVKRDAPMKQPAQVERLVRGDGVRINHLGQLNPIGSILTGTVATFLQPQDASAGGEPPVIVRVTDNRRVSDTKKFYEIVPRGMNEDVMAYVDRPHQWNGLTKAGMPAYLKNADYVKMFARDRARTDLKMKVQLGRPAVFYVLFDERVDPPEWLIADYEDTGDRIGMDLGSIDRGHYGEGQGVGPGADIDVQFKVWKRTVAEPSVISLGLPYKQPRKNPHIGGMYGIAAQPLESDASGGKSLAAESAR